MGKMTSYDELTSVATDDEFLVTDVSDTSMATSGTTKRVKASNLPGGGAGAVASVNGHTGAVVLAASDVAALPAAGGTMSGAIAMGAHKITGVTNGSSAQDVAAFGQIPAALPPNGAAGGDLSGTFPNPGVAKVDGVAVTGTPAAGEVLTATSPTAATWKRGHAAGIFDVTNPAYGAVGDGQVVMDGAMSSSSSPTHLACTTSTPFTSEDVGKLIIVNGAADAGTAAALVTTIASFTDSGHVVLSAAATTTVTGAAVLWATDDTAAFLAAIDDMATYLADHQVATLYRPYPPNGDFYGIGGALITTGGANAQLPIPFINQTTSQAATIILEADIGDGSVMDIWSQGPPQVAGSIVSFGIYTSASAYTTNYGSHGDSCVVGSTPNFPGGGGLGTIDGFQAFSNVLVVARNWSTVCPSNNSGLHYTALSAAGCKGSAFYNCAALITTNYDTNSGANAFPAVGGMSNAYAKGFVPSGNGNNDQALLFNCTMSGHAFGFVSTEHTLVIGGRVVKCWASFAWIGEGFNQVKGEHLGKIVSLSSELCFMVAWVVGAGEDTGTFIDAELDCEGFTHLILDSTAGTGLAGLFGTIKVFGSYDNSAIDPPYPISFKIISYGGNGAGASTPPGWIFAYGGFASAGSNVPVQNPWWRDVVAIVAGGSGVVIKAGVTSGGTGDSATTAPTMTALGVEAGAIPWPSGGWLSITESAAPAVDVCVS